MFEFRLTPLAASVAAFCLVLSGCASLPASTASAAEPVKADVAKPDARTPTPPAAPTTPTAAAAAKPFAEVIKDAKEMPGLFPLYQKDDKVWIEIAPDQLDKLYFLKSNIERGIGENRIYGGMMTYPFGVEQVVVFHKIGQTMQLIAKNVKYTAKEGTPEARAVAQAFSDSLLSSTPVVSQPHPDRKSVLVEANALFFVDLPAAVPFLERTYRQPYAFDARNSSFVKVRALPDMLTLDVNAHYGLTRVNVPPPATQGTPPNPAAFPPPPSTLPDVRSMFIGFHYSLVKLPDQPMRPRPADTRIGYFSTDRLDYSSDTARLPIVRYANHWRLEKKDPTATLSEPKQPIVFWLDRNIPEQYRAPIREGILEWNKAFERIGFKDAIRVEVQPDDADFETSDIRHASVRWITSARPSFGAIGPSVVDPRTAEILDADIGFDANTVRGARHLRLEYVPPSSTAAPMTGESRQCEYDSLAAEQAGFGLALLEARGELEPDSPDVERFVRAYIKDVIMHEVGHTLGLTHNFRASTIYTDAQLADKEFTEQNGISGSVMEYNPWNIALKSARQGEYQMSTLGPYDYWAIEYGYEEIAPEDEAAELERIAGRSSEPKLAFARDDTLFESGLDPEINTFDLSNDPLAYAQKRFALARELIQRTEQRQLKPGEDYNILRRNLVRGLADAQESAARAVKYIGGVTLSRDHAGTSRAPLMPVPPDKQRAALTLITTEVLSADSFRFSPKLLREAGVSFYDQLDAEELGRPMPSIDLAIDQRVLALQRVVLGQVLSEQTAQRLMNNEAKVDSAPQALRLSELYETVRVAVWSELKTGKDINLFRRNLQREHASRLAAVLLKPAASLPADARALFREEAKTLRHDIAAAQGKSGYSKEARAHLAETLSTLDEALKAPLQRQGV